MRTLIVLAVLCAPAVAAPVPKGKADTEAIIGQWNIVEVNPTGDILSSDSLLKYRATINKETVCIYTGTSSGIKATTYKLDATKKHLDITSNCPDISEKKGVYELKGNTLRIAISDGFERPKEVKSGNGVIYFELLRVKEKKE